MIPALIFSIVLFIVLVIKILTRKTRPPIEYTPVQYNAKVPDIEDFGVPKPYKEIPRENIPKLQTIVIDFCNKFTNNSPNES